MEENSYLYNLGNAIRRERNNLHMNQNEFYDFLFPYHDKEPENVKKIMNAIENGKRKSIDIAFVEQVCKKCNVSMDFLFDSASNYRNHEIEFVCQYTGLNENVVMQLYEWNTDKNNGSDLSLIGKAYFEKDEAEVYKAYRKQSAIQFLSIINLLFDKGEQSVERKGKLRKEKYSNLSVIHAIYRMCMSQPKELSAKLLESEFEENYVLRNYPIRGKLDDVTVQLDPSKLMFIMDSGDVIHPLNLKSVLEDLARKQLNKRLDELISRVKESVLSVEK